MTTVHTLASGSSGNAALLSCDGASFLIDAGISCRRITAALKALEERSPLHRIGTTEEDCGPIIAFLASEDSGYFNGQSFMLDGGLHMHS